jgi:hypothetical protein
MSLGAMIAKVQEEPRARSGGTAVDEISDAVDGNGELGRPENHG